MSEGVTGYPSHSKIVGGYRGGITGCQCQLKILEVTLFDFKVNRSSYEVKRGCLRYRMSRFVEHYKQYQSHASLRFQLLIHTYFEYFIIV